MDLPIIKDAAQAIIVTDEDGKERTYFVWNNDGKLDIEAYNDYI